MKDKNKNGIKLFFFYKMSIGSINGLLPVRGLQSSLPRLLHHRPRVRQKSESEKLGDH
jgi:hypothetical protein